MFCPKCATQNMDNARFCRGCGADISMVAVALAGRVPETTAVVYDEEGPEFRSISRRRRRRSKKPATYGKAFENLGVGTAFLIISIIVALFVPSGRFWWFWLLIPTFACFGEGLGQLIQLRRELTSAAQAHEELPASRNAPGVAEPRSTSEIMPPPPSITEGTTRHLGADKR